MRILAYGHVTLASLRAQTASRFQKSATLPAVLERGFLPKPAKEDDFKQERIGDKVVGKYLAL